MQPKKLKISIFKIESDTVEGRVWKVEYPYAQDFECDKGLLFDRNGIWIALQILK